MYSTSATATQKLSYPSCYDVREVNNGIKSSFGMGALSTNGGGFGMKANSKLEMSRRSVPVHLRTEKFKTPGAGTYNARDSVQVLKRDRNSVQDCTWQTTRRGFIDLPKNNPGPGTYQVENL